MATYVSKLAEVHPRATLGENVSVGPFCVVGPQVALGDGCVLDSHVVLTGKTTIGKRNRFWPGVVIGGEPQDRSWKPADTSVEIGDDNQCREGVTIHRGAEKEDGVTRIGNRNMFMANSHVAHNCWVHNDVILVNGVLLGGHVHVHDWATISGNSVVHHFTTIGTVAFVGGGFRVVVDVPPYMLHAGCDDPKIATINVVGMRRRGINDEAITAVKRAFKLMYREFKKIDVVRETLEREFPNVPAELELLLSFVERQHDGKLGRGREAMRGKPTVATPDTPEAGSPRIRRAA
ncbi:MAG: acyl-ACP--UDP-N-acetylglucosamine O-acyltransferase [Planctomycetota bacterium]|nr:acyl-ACP--UDP-N-acetylglucosamine O-acyltransferase [Planctomycetaceae bacterium]MDQ3329126.1 acyl-ACP--UDP-N-acetylglucosamine O-acyltransferase [Planctomycetota bacterium]